MATENVTVSSPTLLDKKECKHTVFERSMSCIGNDCPVCNREIIVTLRGALAVEVAEKNKFKECSEQFESTLKGLRLPPPNLFAN